MGGIAGDILDLLESEMCGKRMPGTSKRPYKNKVVLKFKRESILYHIKNLSFVEGDIIPGGEGHDKHQIIDICEDGNIDRVSQIITLTLARCRELLLPYTKIDVEEVENRENNIEEEPIYTIEMLVPDDFSKTTVSLLERLIEQLIICEVMADWMSITNVSNPTSASNWAARIQGIEDLIERSLYTRTRRVRRTQTPF